MVTQLPAEWEGRACGTIPLGSPKGFACAPLTRAVIYRHNVFTYIPGAQIMMQPECTRCAMQCEITYTYVESGIWWIGYWDYLQDMSVTQGFGEQHGCGA